MAVDVYNLGKLENPKFDVLFEGKAMNVGSYSLNHKVTDYQFLIVHYSSTSIDVKHGYIVPILKNPSIVITSTNGYCGVHGNGSAKNIVYYHFSTNYDSLVIDSSTSSAYITLIAGVK